MTGAAAARRAAARALGRVLRAGAYANVVVDHETEGLDPAGAAVARALLFDALKHLEAIDAAIEAAAGRPVSAIDAPVLDVLRVAVAELAGRGDRPAPVVVDTAVTTVREVRGRAAGFANAVLRRVVPPDPDGPVALPPWLDADLRAAWGDAEAEAFARASGDAPRVGIRVRPGTRPPPGAEPVPGIEDAYLVDRPPGDGSWVQDPASVAVVDAARPRPGERILEVGAAPGGKTAHLVDLVGDGVVALDVHPRRARDAARRVPAARWVVGDGTVAPFAPSTFDLVVLDAPCSGLGTLRRRPEIRLRVGPRTVGELADLQRRLLDAAWGLVRPGGRLVYSVCTVTSEETVGVVVGRGASSPEGLPGRRWGDGLLLAPHLTGTDGMFIAVLARPG